MSLINDALRRAKENQQQASPPPPPMPFRPVEPTQYPRHGLGLLVVAALGVVALLVLLFAWQWVQERSPAEPKEARALTPQPQPATAASQPATPAPPVAPATVKPGTPLESSSQTTPTTLVATDPASSSPAAPGSLPLAQEQADDTTNATAVLSPPAPKPPPLRLQAIVFNPKRPSALISGKTVFVGDKLGDARVVAIDKDGATLVGGGKTNVLTLPE